jgi:hypothetical protein
MITDSDAILWYNVGVFGDLGYAVPNASNDVGSLNVNIVDFVQLAGANLFNILHHEDVDLRIPPSINTLKRVHKLVVRSSQVLTGRAVPPGKDNMETVHVRPGGETFLVYPVPYFRVRNPFLKRWGGLLLMMLAEAMQHTENRKQVEISTDFAGLMGQYLMRIYRNMAIELFGKTVTQVETPGFVLLDADFGGYNPGAFFTSTEMTDTVPSLGNVYTEDQLDTLRAGIPVSSLPALQPWPQNLSRYYKELRAGDANASDFAGDGSPLQAESEVTAGVSFPSPPGP